MAIKFLGIALFITFQVSVVLSRSTLKPNDEEKNVHEGPILFPHSHASVAKTIEEYFAENPGDSIIKNASPSKMSYDVRVDDTYVTYNADAILTAYAIVAIVIGVFSILSLLLGCIIFICCKKQPRRGFIINSNTSAQIGANVPGATGGVQYQPLQEHPPPYEQNQQQNTYQTKY